MSVKHPKTEESSEILHKRKLRGTTRPKKKSSVGKKLEYIETEKYINLKTGRTENIIRKRGFQYRDHNFYKYWPDKLNDFNARATLEERKFLDFLVKFSNYDNYILSTHKALAKSFRKDKVKEGGKEEGHSCRFVDKAMKKLRETNVIVKVRNGVYLLNPGIIFKGTTYRRQKMESKYNDLKTRANKRNI